MDFKDQIANLIERVTKQKDQIKTEEATKTGLVLPFLQCLGYDVFNPTEIVPEFTADIGIKKGEKVDYAIMKEGKPIIIIECKWWRDDLSSHKTQLLRYFNVTDAQIAILTNGIEYLFYAGLKESNRMDDKPFLEFDITQMTESLIEELKKFHKSYFKSEAILNTASELMYLNEMKKLFNNEFISPSPDFVKYFMKRLYKGNVTEKSTSFFTQIVTKSVTNFINDKVNEKIKAALEIPKEQASVQSSIGQQVDEITETIGKSKAIVTDPIELEGYAYVKIVLKMKGIDLNRISYKDTINYFAVILDGSTWKTVCRLWLNQKKKYISLFDSEKKEEKIEITGIDDILNFADRLAETINNFDKEKN